MIIFENTISFQFILIISYYFWGNFLIPNQEKLYIRHPKNKKIHATEIAMSTTISTSNFE